MVRDLGQAQNLKWIMDQEGSEAKMITWAHNAHVNNAQEYGHDMMGVHLRKLYGDQLKIFGFFFNHGEFKALDEGGASKGMHNFTLGPAPEGFLESLMAHASLSTAVLDLQKLPSTGPVYQWFNTPQQIRYSWGGYDVNEPQKYFWNYTLAEAFDALVFLDSTTAVEHLYDSDFDDIWLVNQQLSVPLNTGFEDNKSGEAPDNWVTWSKFQRLGVEMIVSDENPYSGNHSAMLKREEGLKYGEFAPNIRQYIDAKLYRGKKITLRVASRAQLMESNFAFLRMSIDPDPLNDAHEGLPPLYDNLDSCRIDSKDWKIYEVEAQVDERAEIINYGIYLRDFGSVWMDDVTIEIIE